MIVWITGNSGAGKTTMARQMQRPGTAVLNGNLVREIMPTGFTREERWAHNLRVARFAKMLDDQGVSVIIALICPYRGLRREVEDICGCGWIYLDTEPKGEDYPYEPEEDRMRFRQSV